MAQAYPAALPVHFLGASQGKRRQQAHGRWPEWQQAARGELAQAQSPAGTGMGSSSSGTQSHHALSSAVTSGPPPL